MMNAKENNNAGKRFQRMVRACLTQKTTLGQRHEGNEGESHVGIWGQKRKLYEQRSLGRNMPALLKEQEESQYS